MSRGGGRNEDFKWWQKVAGEPWKLRGDITSLILDVGWSHTLLLASDHVLRGLLIR